MKTTIYHRVRSCVCPKGIPENFVLALAQAAVRVGLIQEAIKLLFPYARFPEYIAIRQMYFSLFTMLREEKADGKLEEVTSDCCVYLQTVDNQQWVRITPQTNQKNWLIKLIGKRVGESVEEHREMTNRDITYTILAVVDKYFGIFHEIQEQIKNNTPVGYSIESLMLPETDPEGINKMLITQFGEQGEKLESEKKRLFDDYHHQRITFTQVVQANAGDPIGAYYSLTGYWGKGFWIIPKRLHGSIDISQLQPDTEFVLDFTSVLLFFELSQKQGVRFPKKFLISPFLVDILRLELCRMERQKSPGFNIRITKEGVRPLFYPEDYHENQLAYYRILLAWISENCVAQPNRHKLKLLGEACHNSPQMFDRLIKDAWERYALDTMLMPDMPDIPTILISDDSIFFKFRQGGNKLISSEIFLLQAFPDRYAGEILPFLLKSKYRNIEISEELLEGEFQRFLHEEESLYTACVQNIRGNLPALLQHLQSIYSTPLKLLHQKRMLSQSVINAFTSGGNLPEHLYQNLAHRLRLQFRFFPNSVAYVLDDLNIVCRKGMQHRGFLGGLF